MKPLSFRQNFSFFLLTVKTNCSLMYSHKSVWFSFFLLSIILLVVFPFSFGADVLKKIEVQIGSYWVIQEFVVSLLTLNMFKFESENDVLSVYYSTRNSKLAFFWGKVVFTWLHILSLQIPLVIFWIIIFNPALSALFKFLPTLLLASVLFAFTSAILGGFLHCLTHKNKFREILQPLLFFPLQCGLLLAGVGVSISAQSANFMLEWSGWWNILIVYPILFIGLTLLFGDLLLEE